MAFESQILVQLKHAILNLSFGKKLTLASLVIGFVVGFIFLMYWSGKSEFRPLYTNLNLEDASSILSKLTEQKIEYRITSDGTTILIPEQHLYEIRMKLATAGLPQGGEIGFEIFDNTKLGMTSFTQTVNFQRALQGELARTINRIAEIESSRVHIAMAEKSLFIEEEEPTTASVVLNLRPGKWLNQGQVKAIVNLVSSSVARLSPENVTIVDGNGKMLAGGDDISLFGTLSSDQLDYQTRVERNLENRVKSMLESALGKNKAIVRLSCSFDFKKQERTEELFLQDNKVVRSEQLLKEVTNTPKSGSIDIKTDFEKKDHTVNYEIGKVISRINDPIGEIKRISIAVVVDGSYRKLNAKNKKSEWEYVPRTAEEMEQFESIVKRAVNFDHSRGDKVDIVNIPFENTKKEDFEKEIAKISWVEVLNQYRTQIKYAFFILFLFLSFLFLVKPLVRWLTEYSFKEMQLLKRLPKNVGEMESDLDLEKKNLIYRNEATKLIAKDKETSLRVMRDWIKSG